MSEADAIDRVEEPVTVSSLVADLRALGVGAGDTLLVHSSLSALGWVSGGPQAVVDALMEVVTPEGTLVMPTHTSQYTDPAGWGNPPVPADWVERIHETRPPYRPAITPARGMGAIPECFRDYPGVHRSRHPVYSFAAWGADAATVVDDHPFDFALGGDSPLGRVYDLDGDVLMLGTDYETTTSFHLAEYRADIDIDTTSHEAPISRDGERVMVEYEDIEIDSDDFAELGAAFEADVGLNRGTVGAADSRLVGQRPLVDYAVDWLEANR